jgi:hypothetical protein
MKATLATIAVGAFLSLNTLPGFAQTLPNAIQPQNPQSSSPATISPIQPASAPTGGLPANVRTPATTSQLAPAGAAGRAPVFVGAGLGLPGMPGGPALNSALGARDPTGQYMTPPKLGPLLCDPAVDLAC